MTKKILLLSLVLLLCSVVPALARNYVKPDQFKQWIETSKSTEIVDIQPMHSGKGVQNRPLKERFVQGK